MPERVREPAPAKLNPVLRVRGRREDGFHDIETVILPITLADGVEAARADGGISLRVMGPRAGDVPSADGNLVLSAARRLAEASGVPMGAQLTLVKHTPVGAGLGGGSADAAATLRALNDLWELGWSRERLVAVAADVGSDVPALVHGGPVVARGRGERVDPLAAPKTWWVLVTQPFEVSARDAYAWWDATDPEGGGSIAPAVDALRAGDPAAVAATLANDLEPGVARQHPQVERSRESLLAAGALGAVMSGSGPTVVGLCRDASHAEDVARRTGGSTVATLTR